MGTDNKKVNLVAALLDRPNNLADKIVVPLRENPGIMAKACDKPMIIDRKEDKPCGSFMPSFSLGRFLLLS